MASRTRTPHGRALKSLQPGGWIAVDAGEDRERVRMTLLALARHYGFRVRTWTAWDGRLVVQRKEHPAAVSDFAGSPCGVARAADRGLNT